MPKKKQEREKPAHKDRTGPEEKVIPKTETGTKIQKAFRRVLASEAGIDVFRWLMNECGYKLPAIVRQVNMSQDGRQASIGDILPLSSTYNESKRDVWITIRRQISPDKLNLIEMENENASEEK